MSLKIPFISGLIAVVCCVPLRAQEPQTRAEQLRQEREEKAKNLQPPSPGTIERALLRVESDRVFERLLSPPEGWYPKIGAVTPGGGFAVGPAYRRPRLFGDRAIFGAFAMASLQRYWLLDARLTMPDLANGRLFAEMQGQAYDFPDEDFFGVGPGSLRREHALYGIRGNRFGGSIGARLMPWFLVGGRVDRLNHSIDGGSKEDDEIDPEALLGGDALPIDVRFSDATAPGLDEQPDFNRLEAFAELNYREPRGNPRRGGRYYFGIQRFDDGDRNRFDFTRFEADLQQYLPIYKDRRVLALHLHMSTSDAGEGQRVPFFLQRTLGGPDDLRGFRRFRFRDEHVLYVQAEYRWEIFAALDGAIFYDAGKVASRREDLDFKDLESDYGIGFRFGTVNGVFLRVEGAFGSRDGKHFVLRWGHVF